MPLPLLKSGGFPIRLKLRSEDLDKESPPLVLF